MRWDSGRAVWKSEGGSGGDTGGADMADRMGHALEVMVKSGGGEAGGGHGYLLYIAQKKNILT